MKDRLKSERCSRYLKALASEDRIQIVQALLHGPRSVGEVADLLHEPLPNTSHHLRILQMVGLVKTRRSGKFIYYSLAPKFHKRVGSRSLDTLDFGCCRLELGA